MPKLTIDGKTYEVEAGKRLVLAIEELGVNIGHRCGGNAALHNLPGRIYRRRARENDTS